jgi:hypothetical protein
MADFGFAPVYGGHAQMSAGPEAEMTNPQSAIQNPKWGAQRAGRVDRA